MNRDEEIRIMSLPGIQEKFREAMGKLQITDWIWCPRCKEEQIAAIHVDICDEEIDNYIRLPLPIDPVNPERGVLGMLRGRVSVMSSDGYTPTLALLKALAHQWNVEVE